MRSFLCLVVGTLTGLGLVAAAHATPMSVDYNVDFSSPSESFWGPGQSSANFGYDHLILGNTSFGMRFQTGASTGTVKSNYSGAISVGYDNQVQQGPVDLTLGFQGDSAGGHFDTLLGAFVKVTAYFPVIGGQTVTNPNYSLQTSSTYTPSPPDTPAGSDSFTPASSTIGPDIGVGSAQAGIDYDIVQHSTHTISGLDGTAVATHEGDGQTRSAPFSLDALDTVSLNLDLAGTWDVQLKSLSLDNQFSTTFDLAFVPFVEYTLGLGCGDASKDSDNGILCTGDGRLDTTVASFPFYSNTPFALAMASSGQFASFQIEVAAASQTVPEPATLILFSLALLGIITLRKKRSTRPSFSSAGPA